MGIIACQTVQDEREGIASVWDNESGEERTRIEDLAGSRTDQDTLDFQKVPAGGIRRVDKVAEVRAIADDIYTVL